MYRTSEGRSAERRRVQNKWNPSSHFQQQFCSCPSINHSSFRAQIYLQKYSTNRKFSGHSRYSVSRPPLSSICDRKECYCCWCLQCPVVIYTRSPAPGTWQARRGGTPGVGCDQSQPGPGGLGWWSINCGRRRRSPVQFVWTESWNNFTTTQPQPVWNC